MKILPWRRPSLPTASNSEFEDLFSRFWNNGDGDFFSHLPQAFRNKTFTPVNIAESEEAFSITMDCPGLDEQDIDVELMGSQIIIHGERRWEDEKQGKEFHRVESQYGSFERVVQLPENVCHDPTQVEASYKRGVLTVTVPKQEKTPASKIAVTRG